MRSKKDEVLFDASRGKDIQEHILSLKQNAPMLELSWPSSPQKPYDRDAKTVPGAWASVSEESSNLGIVTDSFLFLLTSPSQILRSLAFLVARSTTLLSSHSYSPLQSM